MHVTGAIAPALLGAGIAAAAVGGAAVAAADPAVQVDPATPCPAVPGPVGPPGVTDVPSALGALMVMWQQARNPLVTQGQFAGPGVP